MRKYLKLILYNITFGLELYLNSCVIFRVVYHFNCILVQFKKIEINVFALFKI